jgi:hypothetical protein
MKRSEPGELLVPRWLRFVLASDRAGSAWYIGSGFFFAPVLAVLSPWPTVTAVLWGVIALAGLWLGLLGIAMAIGLARIMRSGTEIPEDYWRSLVHYQNTTPTRNGH